MNRKTGGYMTAWLYNHLVWYYIVSYLLFVSFGKDASMPNKKDKALMRVQDAENRVMIDKYGDTATQRRQESIAQYRALLDQDETLTERQKQFLAEFMQTGIISRACLSIKLAKETHRRWLQESESYAQAFEDAKQMADEKLELLAYDLANGVFQKPIVSLGQVVAWEPIFDTKMLQTLLKARMPERYIDRKDVTSNGHTIVKLVDKEAWDSV